MCLSHSKVGGMWLWGFVSIQPQGHLFQILMSGVGAWCAIGVPVYFKGVWWCYGLCQGLICGKGCCHAGPGFGPFSSMLDFCVFLALWQLFGEELNFAVMIRCPETFGHIVYNQSRNFPSPQLHAYFFKCITCLAYFVCCLFYVVWS